VLRTALDGAAARIRRALALTTPGCVSATTAEPMRGARVLAQTEHHRRVRGWNCCQLEQQAAQDREERLMDRRRPTRS
jgi:hypothetical protein